MNIEWQEDWNCLECGLVNIGTNYQCARCETDKPTVCDFCGVKMIPWREAPKTKLEKYTCRKCHYTETEP